MRYAPDACDKLGDEAAQLLPALRGQAPVPPGGLVVLAIGIVVAALRASELVAGEQHRRAVGKQDGCEHCPLNARADFQNRGIRGLTLNAPVGRIVLAMAVPVVLTVRFIVRWA